MNGLIITERHRQTLLRQARKYIADLEAKLPSKNKAGASRRQSCINRARRMIACLEAGDHPSQWHMYNVDGTRRWYSAVAVRISK